MTQRIRDHVQRHAEGVGGFEALGVGVGFTVERALEIEGRVEHGEALLEEEAVKLGVFQRGIVAQRGRREGDFLQHLFFDGLAHEWGNSGWVNGIWRQRVLDFRGWLLWGKTSP